MNLSEALNAALPELPVYKPKHERYRLDPNVIAREQVEEGKATVVIHKRGTTNLFHLSPEQWSIVELFDGTRTVEDVAEIYAARYGTAFGLDDIREFCAAVAAEDIWYRSPQEKNIALM